MKDKTIVWLLFLLLVVYNIIDTLQTIMLLELGEGEANPIYQMLINTHGTGVIWVVKTVALFFLAIWIAYDSYLDRKRGKDGSLKNNI